MNASAGSVLEIALRPPALATSANTIRNDMPIYEYQCTQCNERHETIQRFSDPPLSECPSCGGAMKKLPSSPAIQFKGSGFYKTDYASGSGAASSSSTKSETKSSDGSAASTASETKSETKTESKSETKSVTKSAE
jgi:putative FmdB family regulatory protein